MLNKAIKLIICNVPWICSSYEVREDELELNCHYLWLIYKKFYIPFNELHIQKCIMLMGLRINLTVCQIAIDNRLYIRMYRHANEQEVLKYADNLIKTIRAVYAGQLDIS